MDISFFLNRWARSSYCLEIKTYRKLTTDCNYRCSDFAVFPNWLSICHLQHFISIVASIAQVGALVSKGVAIDLVLFNRPRYLSGGRSGGQFFYVGVINELFR